MGDLMDADVLVIGAGPAGASTAILLQRAGWRVILVEKSSYPRQKVCGECLSAVSRCSTGSASVPPFGIEQDRNCIRWGG